MGDEGINSVADATAALEAANNAAPATETAPPAFDFNTQQPQQQQPSSNAGGHPAWQEVLSKVPEALHPQLRPVLEQWDKGVQDRFSQVHSQYAPYKQFLEANIAPDSLGEAYQLWQMLNNDPQRMYEQLGNFLGVQQGGQGQQQQIPQNTPEVDLGEFGQEFDLTKHPQYQALMQQQQALQAQQQMLMQNIQQAQMAEQQRQADVWIDQQQNQIAAELNSKFGMNLTTDRNDKNSAPVWDYILKTAAVIAERTHNYDEAMRQAANQYVNLVSSVRNMPNPSNAAPPVIPPSNGVPSSANVDASNMDSKAKRAYGAQLLAAMNRES